MTKKNNKTFKELTNSEKEKLQEKIRVLQERILTGRKIRVKPTEETKSKLKLSVFNRTENKLIKLEKDPNANINKLNALRKKVNRDRVETAITKNGLTIYEFTGPNLSLVKSGDLDAYLANKSASGEFDFSETASDLNNMIKMYGEPIVVQTKNINLTKCYTNHTIKRDNIIEENKKVVSKYNTDLKYREEYDLEVEETEGDYQVKE